MIGTFGRQSGQFHESREPNACGYAAAGTSAELPPQTGLSVARLCRAEAEAVAVPSRKPCTHKDEDFEACRCACEVCGLVDCVCCARSNQPDCESLADLDDDYWDRVDEAYAAGKDGLI